MTSRDMLVTFEELLRATNPDLEFDTNINTDVIYTFLTRAEQEYISLNFLSGDSIIDNINAVRKRSDVLRGLIKRCDITRGFTHAGSLLADGGYAVTFDANDYWMFLSGILYHNALPTTNKGSDIKAIELDLINHYDLQKKVRTITNEPVLKMIPIVLEAIPTTLSTANDDIQITSVNVNSGGSTVAVSGIADPGIPILLTLSNGVNADLTYSLTSNSSTGLFSHVFSTTTLVGGTNYTTTAVYDGAVSGTSDGFIFYLSKEYNDAIGTIGNFPNTHFNIIYLAFPPAITSTTGPSLAISTHNDIVKIAVDIYIKEYKYLLGQAKTNQNG